MSPQHGNMCLIKAHGVPIWECTFQCENEHSQCVINYDICGNVQYMLLGLGTCFPCLGKFHAWNMHSHEGTQLVPMLECTF
jgi:hypothetical protein